MPYFRLYVFTFIPIRFVKVFILFAMFSLFVAYILFLFVEPFLLYSWTCPQFVVRTCIFVNNFIPVGSH